LQKIHEAEKLLINSNNCKYQKQTGMNEKVLGLEPASNVDEILHRVVGNYWEDAENRTRYCQDGNPSSTVLSVENCIASDT